MNEPDKYREEYSRYRNRLNRIIRAAKCNYFRTKIYESKDSTKQLWKTLNKMYRTKDQNVIKCVRDQDGSTVEDAKRMADIFNHHYINVGKNLADNIKTSGTPASKQKIVTHSFFIKPTTPEEIKQIIDEIKCGKAPGYDNISGETIRNIRDEIAVPFSNVINGIIESGICPKEFKVSVVIPLFKNKGPTDSPSNYRPISLVTSFTKVFEKIIEKRLRNYLDKHKIISDRQFGFRKGRSTSDAVSTLCDQVYRALDSDEVALCVFLDLCKAFDTVNHSIMLDVLEGVGVRGVPLKLFGSYLRDRTQMVKIGDYLSDPLNIQYGIPQGTVLGPILFNLYINDILNIEADGSIIGFADDTAVLYRDTTWEKLKCRAERDLEKIFNAFSHRYLTINLEKTKYLPFSIYKPNLPLFDMLKIRNAGGNLQIASVTSIKYLGVFIDQFLRWDIHVNSVVATLRHFLYRFRFLCLILERRHLKMLYHALVESRLRYGILAWGGLYDAHLRRLQVIQNTFLRIILQKERLYPTDKLYLEAGVLDIRQIYVFNLLIYTYNNKNILTYLEHDYDTRGKAQQKVSSYRAKKTIGQRTHTFLIPHVLNSLPLDLRVRLHSLNSFGLFRSTIRNYLRDTDRHNIANIVNSLK